MATTGWRGQRERGARGGDRRGFRALALVAAVAVGGFTAVSGAGPQTAAAQALTTTTTSGSGSGSGPVVFGPEDFVRTTAAFLDVTRTFRVSSADGPFTLCVDNGGARDQYPFVTRGEVELNDRFEIEGRDFSARPPFVARPVRVRPGLNALEIEIESARGTGFTVSVVRGNADACPGMGGGANRVPTISTSAVTTGAIGQPYAYDVNATDADNDPLTYSLTTSPSGMTIVPGTGLIAWTPTAAGTFPVVVSVSDGRGGVATQSFSIVVPQPNRAPTFASSPVTSATVNSAYAYDVNAIDADNDALTYALTTSPTGMTIAPATGIIAWTPAAAGTFPVVVSVSDGRGGVATQSFSIVVPQPNRAPTFTSSPVTSATVNNAYAYDADATDPDNDPLTYALTTFPTGMTIAPATGIIAWTPAAAGTFPVAVSVSDGRGGVATQSFSIVVPQPNRAPTFASSPVTSATVNSAYAYDADATDPDNDPLTYALTTFPTGMTIAPATGIIAWTPTAAGTFPVVVSVSDGRGGVATQSFSIVVPAVSTNHPPTATDDAYVVPIGQTMTVPAPGLLNNDGDPDGDPITAAVVAGSSPDKGTLSGPNPDGSFTYEAPSGPSGPPFQPVVRYKAQMDGGYLGHYEIDVTGDGVRDVIVKSFTGFAAFDGPTGAVLWSFAGGYANVLPPPYTQPCRVTSGWEGWAVGDIDDDGIPEVVTTANCDPSVYDGEDFLMTFDARTGAEKWVSQRLSVNRGGNPGAAYGAGLSIARLTPDDVPVILFGNSQNSNDCAQYVESAPAGTLDCRRVTIVDGPTGAKRRTMYSLGAAVNNRQVTADRNETQNHVAPIVFDLDRDGEVEIVYAGAVFALDGHPKWELPVAVPHVAIGNLDATPDVEVVAVTKLPPLARLGNIEAFKADGTRLWRYPLGNGATNVFSNLTLADIDGDGFADVLFPYYDYGTAKDTLLAVGHDGRLKWTVSMPTPVPWAESGRSRVAVFDLDGDGLPEVIKQEPEALYILDGTDGTVKATIPFGHSGDLGGSMFVPSVADLDGDGRAEIVAVNAGLFNPDYGVWVVRSGGAPWSRVSGGLSQMSSGGTEVSVSGRVPLTAGNRFADRRTNVFGTVAPEPVPSTGNKPTQTSFLYTVSDGVLSTVATVTIDIAPSNRPPVFTSTPPAVYTPNGSFVYAAFAVDPDQGDVVSYRIGAIYDQDAVAIGGPGCAIDSVTGLLSCGFMAYNTSKDPLVQILIIATDSRGGAASQLVSVVPITGAPRVPDVLGMPQPSAMTAITTAGLLVGHVQSTPSGAAAGQVISQTPPAGTYMPAGAVVSLVVSAGPPPVTVPDVVGRTQAAAQGALVSARLALGAVTQATSATVPAGHVITQTPAAGASAPSGSAVDLVISRGTGLVASLATGVVTAGDAVTFRVQVVDTAGAPVVPAPPTTVAVLGQPGEYAGPLPVIAGTQVTTVAATRGVFTVRVTDTARGAVVDLPLVVTNDTSSGPQQVAFSQLGAAVQRTADTFEAVAAAVAANDLAAIQTLKDTLQATRNALDLEALRTRTAFAPSGGFLPTPAQLDAAGHHGSPADDQWLQALTDVNARFAEIEAYVRQMRLGTPVNDEARLATYNGQLDAAVDRLLAVTPTLNGTVKYGSLMQHLLSVRVPALLDAQLERVIATLQQKGLAASVRPALDGYLASLDRPAAADLGPAAFYAQAVPTDYSLSGLLSSMGIQGKLIQKAYVPTIGLVVRSGVIMVAADLLQTWGGTGPLDAVITTGSVSFNFFGQPGSVIEGEGLDLRIPEGNDVFVVGPDAVSAVFDMLGQINTNKPKDRDELDKKLTALRDKAIGVVGAYQKANQRPDGTATGCIFNGAPQCGQLVYSKGFASVYKKIAGSSSLPAPVLVIVTNVLTGEIRQMLAAFFPTP